MGLGAPSAQQQDALSGMAQHFLGAAQETMETSAAIEESLQGVSYKVHFHRPSDAGGSAAGKNISLDLDALALVGDVQQIVELELFGSTGSEPVFLILDGRLLSSHLPLHHAGVEDGKAIDVAAVRPRLTEQE